MCMRVCVCVYVCMYVCVRKHVHFLFLSLLWFFSFLPLFCRIFFQHECLFDTKNLRVKLHVTLTPHDMDLLGVRLCDTVSSLCFLVGFVLFFGDLILFHGAWFMLILFSCLDLQMFIFLFSL